MDPPEVAIARYAAKVSLWARRFWSVSGRSGLRLHLGTASMVRRGRQAFDFGDAGGDYCG
jgi:hypothetical protein